MVDVEMRVLLLAPTNRDAQTAIQLLTGAGLDSCSCSTIGEVCRELVAGAGVAIIPEEIVDRDSTGIIADVLKSQPTWSDLPLIILTTARKFQTEHLRKLLEVGNVTLLRRPLDVTEFLNAVRAALRDRKRQYQVRAHLAEEARQAEALRDSDRRKDEFLAMLAHELRNPLAPIRNGLQILQLAEGNRTTVARTREMIDRQVNHLSRLVDDLLDVSRITRGKVELRPERTDLRDVVASAVETIRPLVDSRRHQLTVSGPGRPVWAWVDATRMAQVIGNLLTNSAKYSEEEGHINISLEEHGGEIVIRVRDTGVGIAADMLPRVFDLFTQVDQTLDRSQGGLGIGLTLVRNLVEMHGGTVTAESEGEGRGSTFTIILPGAAEVTLPADPDLQSFRLSTQRFRVLVVDDNQDAGQSLGELLRLLGHRVEVVATGPRGLDVARDLRPEVALLDIGLPGMDGYELAKRLRSEPFGSRLLLIALTGYGQDEDRRKTKEAGFDHHLTKPASLRTIQSLLALGKLF
jgi:signal transduction histidine kinase